MICFKLTLHMCQDAGDLINKTVRRTRKLKPSAGSFVQVHKTKPIIMCPCFDFHFMAVQWLILEAMLEANNHV